MVYKSKVDYWVLVLIIVPMVIASINSFNRNASFSWDVAVPIVIIAAILVVFLTIRYSIEGENLVISGYFFYRKVIPISKIEKIERTKSPWSAPAASFQRLEIVYNKFDSILISPIDRDAFVNDLLQVNSSIAVK